MAIDARGDADERDSQCSRGDRGIDLMRIHFSRFLVPLTIGLAIVVASFSARAQDQFNVNTDPCEEQASRASEKTNEEQALLNAEATKGTIDCNQQSDPGRTTCYDALQKKIDAEQAAIYKERADIEAQTRICHDRASLGNSQAPSSSTDPNLVPGLHQKRFGGQPAGATGGTGATGATGNTGSPPQTTGNANITPPNNSPGSVPYASASPGGVATSETTGSGYAAPGTSPAPGASSPSAGITPALPPFELSAEANQQRQAMPYDKAPRLVGLVGAKQPPRSATRVPQIAARGQVNGWNVTVYVTGVKRNQWYQVNTPMTDQGNSPYKEVYGYYAGNQFSVTAYRDRNGWTTLQQPVPLVVGELK
jgi:hypothetical protein